VSTLGVVRLGTAAFGGGFVRNPPTVTITSPDSGEVLTDGSGFNVTWTYSSPLSRPQVSYRVRILDYFQTNSIFDTGFIPGTATSYAVSFSLPDAANLWLEVSASDSVDVGIGTVQFSTSLETGAGSNLELGTMYEVAINGVGYMLADKPGTERQYLRRSGGLESPRFATGQTPFTESIDRYTYIGFADFSGGGGQRYLNRDTSDQKRYLDSYGVDPFTPGELKLLPATDAIAVTLSSYAPYVTVAGDDLYVRTDQDELTKRTPGGSNTVFNVAGAGTISDLTSDGTYWYVCDGTAVWRNDSAADPGGSWSTVDAKVIHWGADRICAAYATAPSSTPNTFTTLTTAGAEEVVSGRIILPAGSTITSICSGDGYVWFTVKRGQLGLVYAWKAGTADAPFIVWESPRGQFPTDSAFYQGNLFIRTSIPKTTGSTGIIWRGPVSEGRPSPARVVELDNGTYDCGIGSFAGNDRFVIFTWPGMTAGADTVAGTGAIDLASGGYAKWLYDPDSDPTFAPYELVVWGGKLVISGYTGAEASLALEQATYMPSGSITSSISDMATPLAKVYDEALALFDPLPSGSTIAGSYSLDGGLSYAAGSFTVSAAGTVRTKSTISREASSIGLILTLTPTVALDDTPVVRAASFRCHALSPADQILKLPINCSDRLAGVNGQELPESGPGSGATRARTLEGLVQTRVYLQDIDWPTTQSVSTWEVVDCEVTSAGVFDSHRNRMVYDQVAMLTLRKVLT
jgi:hypothetical protein